MRHLIRLKGTLLIYAIAALTACIQTSGVKNAELLQADSLKISEALKKSVLYEQIYPDSAIFYADKALKYAQRRKLVVGVARSLQQLSELHAVYGNLKLAIHYEESALRYFHKIKAAREAASGTADLALYKARQRDFSQAKILLQAALADFVKFKDTVGIIKVYTRQGEMDELQDQTATALAAYQKAEYLREHYPLADDYFELLNNIGQLYIRRGNYREAAAYFEKGIRQSTGNRFAQIHIKLMNHAGKAYAALGNQQKALDLHRQGLKQARQNGLHEEEARSLMSIAGTIKAADAGQSIIHLRKALGIADSIGNRRLASEIYNSLSDIYREHSQYREALETLSAHHRLLDSLMNAAESHRIAALQTGYELAESKLRADDLRLANNQQSFRQIELMFVLAAVLLLLLLITFYFLRTRKLNRALTKSNEIKDKLFSIIGHDLRNPIGGITQLLAVMQEGNLSSEELQELINAMKKQGDVTLEILNALLNWGEAQLKGIHVKPISFNAQASILKNMMALSQQALDKAVTVNNEVSHAQEIQGDRDHFEFVIRNLLSNAIKFSHAGREVTIRTETHADGKVIFSVTDQGQGISKAQQELFLRSNMDIAYGTHGEKGTGIGLMLSKEFVAANGGRIWLSSEEGTGTTFYFSFPGI